MPLGQDFMHGCMYPVCARDKDNQRLPMLIRSRFICPELWSVWLSWGSWRPELERGNLW